jgi:hypothetical protein
MKGLYVYCIRMNSGTSLRVRGIEGKSKAASISYKDIEAVVSAVDLKEYGSKELARRAQEDLKWIIKYAQKHEHVIEAVMGLKKKNDKSKAIRYKLDAVIPMKFGMIFKNQQNIEDMLQKEYKKFKKLLTYFTGKQEWNVTVYAKEAALKEKLKSSDKNVRLQITHAKNLPRGADYFGEIEVNKTLNTLLGKNIESLTARFFRLLSVSAAKSRNNKVLTKEFAGRQDSMVLNSAYLIYESKVRDFAREVKKLQTLYPEFAFEYTGPWPPYNFV